MPHFDRFKKDDERIRNCILIRANMSLEKIKEMFSKLDKLNNELKKKKVN